MIEGLTGVGLNFEIKMLLLLLCGSWIAKTCFVFCRILQLQNLRKLESYKEQWWNENPNAVKCDDSGGDDGGGISIYNIGILLHHYHHTLDGWSQCDQIGLFLKVSATKFLANFSNIIGVLWVILKNVTFKRTNYVATFWPTFVKKCCFLCNIWSHLI